MIATIILLAVMIVILILDIINSDYAFLDIFKDNGKPSWLRWASTVALFVWAKTTITYSSDPTLYQSEFYLILTVATFAPKLIQKIVEKYVSEKK